jgi:hypothetical protein
MSIKKGGNTMSPINFVILKSKLLYHPTGYTGRVEPASTVDFAGLVNRVADSQTSVAKSDVLGVLEDYHRIIEKLLQDGMNVITPHVRYRLSIRGPFADEADRFDAARHELRACISAGARLRKALRDAEMERIVIDPPHPQPLTYYDVASDQRNTVLTSGGSGRLIGRNLEFDAADPTQGVFFLDAGGVATRVAAMIWNKERHLIFTVPVLASGAYTLEVRAMLNNTHDLRVGKLDAVLTVA